MRTASTIDATEKLIIRLKGNNLKSKTILEYEKDSTFIPLDDVDEIRGIDWTKSLKRFKYANFGLTPLASTIKFNVINKLGEYSPGSGTSKDNVLDIDTRIRLKSGYVVPDNESCDITTVFPLDSPLDSFTFNTIFSASGGDHIELDIDNTDGNTEDFFNDLFDPLYDASTYDAETYTHDAYFVSTVDNAEDGIVAYDRLSVTANTTKGTIYYRAVSDRALAEANDNDSTFWINGGTTVNGTRTIIVSEPFDNRFFQIAIVFDATSWTEDIQITNIVATGGTSFEIVYTDVYHLDTPKYNEPSTPIIPTVTCSGRDIFKRAIETEVNLKNISGDTLDEIVKDISDSVGLKYTASSIDDLSLFNIRTLTDGLGEPKKVVDIFEFIMQIINKESAIKYRMFLEYDAIENENILFIKPKPDPTSADFVFNYRHYQSLGSKSRNYDKLLKRLTVLNKQEVSDKEELLILTNHVTTGTKIMSWVGDAEYKRYTTVINSGDGVVTLTEVNPTNIEFEITGTSIDVTITIFGNRWTSPPSFEGESINNNNMINNQGITSRLINPLVISDDEAKDIAEGFLSEFGSPINEIGSVKWPYMHLLMELNDTLLIWSRFIFEDNIYNITGIKYHWDSAPKPGDSTFFNLDDTGVDFSDLAPNGFIYDDVLKYDIGFIYDMALGPQATEDDVDLTKYKNDISFI